MKKTILLVVLLIIFIIVISIYYQNYVGRDIIENAESTLIVKSSAFNNGGMIPSRYTCESENISPEISWENAPEGTKSFVVIVTDYDAPSEKFPIITFVHWVVYNIPANVLSLPEGVPVETNLDNGSMQGNRSFGGVGYTGPCPPMGTHEYSFKVYALDTTLNLLPEDATKKRVLEFAKGHVLGIGELIGIYKKQ
ncbi:MAG: YbhB/YbcL family Raf kinase inhibitor-like protein [Spirochaetota bacterium]|nr:YbhB/YbcL family Raf kinase inhibitor-like protein [Spirochaetota bacterium]